MSGSNKRKVYVSGSEDGDACPKCGSRHFSSASAWKRGDRVIVERICRNCGEKV